MEACNARCDSPDKLSGKRLALRYNSCQMWMDQLWFHVCHGPVWKMSEFIELKEFDKGLYGECIGARPLLSLDYEVRGEKHSTGH